MWTFHKQFCFICVTVLLKAAEGEILLVSHNHGILQVNVTDKTNASVLNADRPVVAFDTHRAWRQLFWATESAIYRTPLYDLNTITHLAEVGRVGSLTVDWVHHHLYWTDLSTGAQRVEAAHIDGRRRRVVHTMDGTSKMGAMVLDPLLGKLFWIEWDNEKDNVTRIAMCNLDGSDKTIFYKSELIPRDSPLAIDITYNSIYFYKVTGNQSELWDANYEVIATSTRLFKRTEEPPKSLCLAKDGFYFSNKNGTYSNKWMKQQYTFVYGNETDTVFSLDPYFRLLDSSLKNVSQICLMSERTQPNWPNQCDYHQCEHECVVTSSHRLRRQPHHSSDQENHTLCVCRYGYKLREDGRTCEERGYLVYSSGTTFGRITTKGKDNTLLYNDTSANIQTFDVDVESQYIYWSDLFAQTIYRAPIEQLTRREAVVSNVTAFGLAFDWLHRHIYWTDQSHILVANTNNKGQQPVVVVDKLNSPSNMAVDPIDKYIFWVECSSIQSIKRAGLDGSDVIMLVNSEVTCGMSLTADHDTHTLFILDWAGAVSLCRYDGSARTKLFSDVVHGVAIIDHQPLWTLIEYATDTPEDVDAFFQDQLKVLAHDLQPSMVKVVKTSHQPLGTDVCADVECSGICIPTKKSDLPRCACPGSNKKLTSCPEKSKQSKGTQVKDFLEVVELSPFSVTLQCAGPLMKYHMTRVSLKIEEVDSLVDREEVKRMSETLYISNRSLLFTVDGLNPATTYRLSVPNRVTRASLTTELQTPPPPLTIKRHPLITVPGIPGLINWHRQGVHYTNPNPWEHLVHREYFLLLLSRTKYTQFDSPTVPQEVLDLLNDQIDSSFMVLNSYASEEEFDDDPEMYLVHVPWGETFRLAMVQATVYKGSYNLDIVYSENFSLPDPYWRPFVEEIFAEQEVINSIERL